MEVLINNPQKGRLETINVEFTKNNTTWFAVKDKGIKMITDFEGGLLITEWGYTYPLLVYDITRADIGYNQRKAQKIIKTYT